MGKKAVTWMDVIREQLAKLRKEGKKPSIGDVTPYAKKEWAEIKAGKHPLYIQGSSKGKSKSSKSSKPSKSGNKTQKLSKKMLKRHQKTQKLEQPTFQQMLAKAHLCKKCSAKVQKMMKTQKGGSCGCNQTGGGCGCDQSGGKKNKKTRKLKGGAKAEPFVQITDDTEGADANAEATDAAEDTATADADTEGGLLDGPEETGGAENVDVVEEI